MNKTRYIQEARRQLLAFYRQQRDGVTPSGEQKGRVEGFMQAGVWLGIYTRSQRDQLIDEVYEQVFGDIPAEQQERQSYPSKNSQSNVLWQQNSRDYSEFDAPAIERHKLSGKQPSFLTRRHEPNAR